MIFAHLDHKIRYLRQNIPSRLAEELLQIVKDVLARQAGTSRLTEPMVRILQLDLVYALCRHQMWLSAPVFPEVVMEFLNSDHKLPRQVSAELVQELTDRLPKKDAGGVDRNRLFLHAIFIACATARDEASLLADLGLGAGLLRCIKNAAESLVRNPGNAPGTIAFLPEVDGILHEVMAQMADELKVTPWACDLHRLRLAFMDADLEAWGESVDAFARKVFQLLLITGRSGAMGGPRMDEVFQRLFPTPKIDPKTARQRLLDLCIAHDLIFNDPSVAAGLWQLTPQGYDLTAEAFACKFLRVPQPMWEQIPHAQASYQTAALRKIGAQHVPAIMDLLRHNAPRFAPKALTLAIERLSKHAGHDEICALIRPLLARADAPWLKAAACEGLGLLAADESVGQLLDQLARSDGSKRVQDAAHEALARWRHKTSVMG